MIEGLNIRPWNCELHKKVKDIISLTLVLAIFLLDLMTKAKAIKEENQPVGVLQNKNLQTLKKASTK